MDDTDKDSAIPPIPKEIAAAIAKVMCSVKKIKKDGTNSFEKWKYASTDAFYDAVRIDMAEQGLVLIPLEGEVSVKEVVHKGTDVILLMYCFRFVLAHTSGATWAPETLKRTVPLRWSGAQTCGIAQSYADKVILRGLFKISVDGEEDIDSTAREEMESAVASRALMAERKSRGGGGRMYTLNFPSGVAARPIAELAGIVRAELAGVDKDGRYSWRRANDAQLAAIAEAHKQTWLEIMKIVEA